MAGPESGKNAEFARALEGLEGADVEAALERIKANPALAARIADLARRLPGSLAAGNFNCVCGAQARRPGEQVINPGG